MLGNYRLNQVGSKFRGYESSFGNHPIALLKKKTQNIFLQPIATLPKGFTFAVP